MPAEERVETTGQEELLVRFFVLALKKKLTVIPVRVNGAVVVRVNLVVPAVAKGYLNKIFQWAKEKLSN